ncbi:MAG: EamA family transporter RarD [Thermodesulfobacteriota bacterium]
MDKTGSGTMTTISAFLMWGVFPIYWKALQHVSSTQILAHRVIWSLVFIAILISIRGRWRETKIFSPFYPNAIIFIITAFILGTNWLTYIWAINSEHIVESSLGYFINPLVNVLLGMTFLRERLYRLQMFSLILALTGVLFLIFQYNRIPWIALVLAFSFGAYGLLRKTSRAGSLVGLFFDTAILAPIFLTYLIVLHVNDSSALFCIDRGTDLLLIGAGLVTAIPLLLFAYGARRIRYTAVGFFQYITPTGLLLCGILLYGEPFTATHAISFGFVWLAIVIYSISAFILHKRVSMP